MASWIVTYMARNDHTLKQMKSLLSLRLLSNKNQFSRDLPLLVTVLEFPKRFSLPLHYAMFCQAINWS